MESIHGPTILSRRYTTPAYGILAVRGRCHPRRRRAAALVRQQPAASGLPAPVYNLVRYSGEARVAAVAAIVDKYLEDADYDAILANAGLAAADIADDEVPAG